jgi:hypothetical protein
MMTHSPFSIDVSPNWEGLLQCIQRRGTPQRVYFIELFLDQEVQQALCERYDLLAGIDPRDSFFEQKRLVILQRFLGYDYMRAGLDDWDMPVRRLSAQDTAGLERVGGRSYMEEHRGPITNWEELRLTHGPIPRQPRPARWNGTRPICPRTCASSGAVDSLTSPNT